ncbi:interferon alpha-1-like [Odocoileus virginianus]|uniref:Interferon alpha-1-like n=1 Tax=Odocoileus virginianus TaxID=9874 RepID=A0ABM4HUP3_ODOVR
MTQGTCYHQVMLQQIFNLFTTESSCAAWNSALLDKLLSSLEILQTPERKPRAPGLKGDSSLALRKYFHGVTLYLQEKGHSPCAWEVVRAEVMRAFASSTHLQERFRRKD